MVVLIPKVHFLHQKIQLQPCSGSQKMNFVFILIIFNDVIIAILATVGFGLFILCTLTKENMVGRCIWKNFSNIWLLLFFLKEHVSNIPTKCFDSLTANCNLYWEALRETKHEISKVSLSSLLALCTLSDTWHSSEGHSREYTSP